MSMPFSQVTFTFQPKAKFGRLAGLIQKRVHGRQYAVSDCEVDEEARSVQCRWKRSVGYKSVQSWFGQALGDSDAEWVLRSISEKDVGTGDEKHPERLRWSSLALSNGLATAASLHGTRAAVEAADAPAVPAKAEASSAPSLPAPTLGRLAEVAAADALAAHAKAAASFAPSLARPAEFEAAVAPAAPAKAEATSAAYEVLSGPVFPKGCACQPQRRPAVLCT